MERDWRDERIAELEDQLRSRDARIAELEERLGAEDARATELAGQLGAGDARIAELERVVAELQAKLGQNSGNSHLPPSSDSPDERRKRKNKQKAERKRKRGAQKGHRGSHRELVPEDKVSKFVDLYPPECENCWHPLPEVADAEPQRHQQTEIPPLEPYTTEWRRHAVSCSCCGHRTRAAYDENVIPASSFGPRLMAIIALLTGVYHLSRRKAATLLSDAMGVRVSLGALSAVESRVSNAVQPAVDAAWQQVVEADVKHTDGTSWAQAGLSMALWTVATTAATVFKIVGDSTKATLQSLFSELHGILVSDRAKALNFWAMELRQICWAQYADLRIIPTCVRKPLF